MRSDLMLTGGLTVYHDGKETKITRRDPGRRRIKIAGEYVDAVEFAESLPEIFGVRFPDCANQKFKPWVNHRDYSSGWTNTGWHIGREGYELHCMHTGWTRGAFGAAKTRSDWSIDHLPSGFHVTSVDKLRDAKRFVGLIAPHFCDQGLFVADWRAFVAEFDRAGELLQTNR